MVVVVVIDAVVMVVVVDVVVAVVVVVVVEVVGVVAAIIVPNEFSVVESVDVGVGVLLMVVVLEVRQQPDDEMKEDCLLLYRHNPQGRTRLR